MARAAVARRTTVERAAAAGVAVIALGVAVTSCAELVGIEGNYRNAIANMCTCDDVAGAFGGDKEKCTDLFDGKLATAKPSDVRAWLDRYLDLSCDLCTESYATTKLDCVHAPPFCAADGAACGAALDCCGYPSKSACLGATVGAGVCGACKAEGATCATDHECCGYHEANPFLGFDPPYCSKLTKTCVREPADCGRTFSSCPANECCQGDVFHQCQPNDANPAFRFCVEACDPENPHNCPGCCAVTYQDEFATEAFSLCADGQPEECGRYCTAEGKPCGKNGTCVRSCEPVPGVLVSLSSCYLACVEG